MSISLPRHIVEDFRATAYFKGDTPSSIILKRAIEPYLKENPSEITVKRLDEQIALLQQKRDEQMEVIAGQAGLVNKKARQYIQDEYFKISQAVGDKDINLDDERSQRLMVTPSQVKKMLRGASLGHDIPMLEAIKLLVDRLQKIDGQQQPNYQRLWYNALKQAKLELQEEGLLDALQAQPVQLQKAREALAGQEVLLEAASEIAARESQAGDITFTQAQAILEKREAKTEKLRRGKNGRFSKTAT